MKLVVAIQGGLGNETDRKREHGSSQSAWVGAERFIIQHGFYQNSRGNILENRKHTLRR